MKTLEAAIEYERRTNGGTLPPTYGIRTCCAPFMNNSEGHDWLEEHLSTIAHVAREYYVNEKMMGFLAFAVRCKVEIAMLEEVELVLLMLLRSRTEVSNSTYFAVLKSIREGRESK